MLEITRRDDKDFTLYFFDEDGTATDLTSCSLLATVKQSLEDLDAAAKISKTLTISGDPTTGIATLTFDATDTAYLLGNYFIDIQLINSSGKASTVLRDTLVVLGDVTIRES